MAENIELVYVIDASFLLAYLFPDEDIKKVQQVFDLYKAGKIKLIAPLILPFEIFNGLQSGILTKRVDKEIVEQLGGKFIELDIELREVEYLAVLALAIKSQISFYDASYLYLAKEHKLELLTLDERLKPR